MSKLKLLLVRLERSQVYLGPMYLYFQTPDGEPHTVISQEVRGEEHLILSGKGPGKPLETYTHVAVCAARIDQLAPGLVRFND